MDPPLYSCSYSKVIFYLIDINNMGVFLEILKVVSNKNSYQTNDG